MIKSSSSEDDVIKWEYNYEQLSQRSKLNIRYIKDDIIKSILIVLIIIILNRLFFLWSITDNYYFLFIEMTLLTVYVYYANIRNLDLTSTSFKTVMFLNNYIVSTNKVIILNTPDYKLKNISYNKKTSEIILHFFDFEYSQDRILEVIYVPPDKKFIVDEIINKYKSIIEKVST